MSKILRNTTGSTIVVSDTGVSVPSMSNYTIPPQDYMLWAASDNVITFIGDGDFVVNDGTFDLSISDGIDLIKGYFPKTMTVLPYGNSSCEYDEATSVASGVETTILTFLATSDSKLLSIECAGTNIAQYTIELDSAVLSRKYTNFGADLNCCFNYPNGFLVETGSTITVKVLHSRPYVGNFNSTITYIGA